MIVLNFLCHTYGLLDVALSWMSWGLLSHLVIFKTRKCWKKVQYSQAWCSALHEGFTHSYDEMMTSLILSWWNRKGFWVTSNSPIRNFWRLSLEVVRFSALLLSWESWSSTPCLAMRVLTASFSWAVKQWYSEFALLLYLNF